MARTPRILIATLAFVVVVGSAALAARMRQAGPQGDGTAVTPTGWFVTPAGQQTRLGNLPTALALSPDARTLLVVNAGQGTQSLQVLDAASGKVVQTIEYPSPEAVFAGLAWSRDGRRAYASGGGNNKVRVYDVDGQRLTERAALQVAQPDSETSFVTGIALAPDGKTLYVAEQQGNTLAAIDVEGGAVRRIAVGADPYGVAMSPDGRTVYVSNQGARTISVIGVAGGGLAVRETVRVGTHPNKMVVDQDSGRLYVANADSDSVSVVDPAPVRVVRSIDLAPYKGAEVGSNPDALALSPDGRRLYVANSGNNDVVVVALAGRRSRTDRILGMIPTAWYPTGIEVSGDGRRLFVLNAKGLGAGPNPSAYPFPVEESEYVGSMIIGTLSTIEVPGPGRLARYTARVVENNGFDERTKARGPGKPGGVIPRRPGDSTPIKHVIYVLKENRTYDQVYGSLGKGNGDPALNLFGEESAPNHRELARRFATLDNFYAAGEVSADGWDWSTQANANPALQQNWPPDYSGRNYPYDMDGANPLYGSDQNPRRAYLWHLLDAKKISFRNYGFFKDFSGPGVADPVLAARTVDNFQGYDLQCPDSPGTFAPLSASCAPPRISVWLEDFKRDVQRGSLPTMEFIALPNDHTAGTTPGYPTPQQYVADNDIALGTLVEAVSHSPYWKNTAIFVVEDDAQDGPDHVDAHRTVALAISPYTQTGKVDSTFYSTVSMLRTMELIVGVGPLSQFDAAATPMLNSFSQRPRLDPYTARRPTVPFSKPNGADAPMAAESARQNIEQLDRVDSQVFNQAIWKSVRGADSEMPAPVTHLRTREEADEEEAG